MSQIEKNLRYIFMGGAHNEVIAPYEIGECITNIDEEVEKIRILFWRPETQLHYKKENLMKKFVH